MDDRDFWRRVTQRLVLRRLEMGLKSPNAAAELKGAPSQKTIEQIEKGRIGRVDKLTEYARVLNLSLVDLFRSALGDARETSPQLEEIIRKYYVTTADGQTAIHSVARAVQVREPDQGTPAGPPETPKEMRRAESSTAKRREGR